jgi:transposase
MKSYTRETVLEAIKGSGGIMSHVAAKLRCCWSTAANYVNKWEATKQAMKDEGERVLDLAESQLLAAVKDREPWAVRMMLYTRGKKRGFTERTEIAGLDGESIKIVYQAVPKPEDAGDATGQ